MPVPWPLDRQRAFIPNIAERALTVKQLFDLHSFLQRLCKAKLLKKFPASNKVYLQWHDLNLYQVRDEVIKPVICFREGVETKGYSWAELVAKGPQPPQLMISHWWGGRFVDFMSAIDKIANRRSLSFRATIWVCTFANNQFGEAFGATILQTPFVKAVEMAEATILMVDRDAGSLRRSWCCLELHCTILKEKSLELYTSAGLVGSKAVSSGPLVDAISEWDVRESAANEEAYRRQILNFIADAPEHRGLLTNTRGELALANGYLPQLDPSVDEQSEMDFMHEYRKAFEDLNMSVRVSVIGNLGIPKKVKGCRIENPSHRGITLAQLRGFSRKARRAFKKLWPQVPWQDVTTAQVCRHYILPLTEEKNCSYVELVADEPQVPDIFMDYQFSMSFSDIIASLEWFVEAMKLRDSTVLSFNLLGFNRHIAADEINANSYDEDGNLTIDQCQAECSSILITSGSSDVDRFSGLQRWNMCRARRLYNIECAVRLGQDVYIACNSGVMACTKPFPNGHAKFGTINKEISESMFTINEDSIAMAPCTGAADREQIRAFIEAGNGCDGCGSLRLQRRLQRWSAFHLALVLAGAGDQELSQLKKVSAVPGFSIQSELAKGGLGESALHEAVAADSKKMVQFLLSAGLSPNSTDAMQETPLHYAALAGNSSMVELLLRAAADPLMESIFGETPLDVAYQNAAAFLGYDSSKLVQRLRRCDNANFRFGFCSAAP